MESLSPVQIVLVIVAALSAVGIVVVLIRNHTTYSEYEEFAADARAVASAMHGEVFRDGSDLVMSGNFGKLPAIVRFSNAENTPGMNIRMQAPATFTLAVVPMGAKALEGGRSVIPTGDQMWDARFNTRTDQPTQAKMFLTRQTQASLHQLCCSSRTYVTVASGAVEVSELTIPTPSTARHILDHMKHITVLADNLRSMPGAEKVKIVPFVRERHIAARVAIAIAAIVALGSVFAATQIPGRQAQQPSGPVLPAGVLPVDAMQIPNVDQWRVANSDDYQPTPLNWLRGNGIQPAGRIEGDFSGTGHGRDVVYVLVGANGARRIVVLAEGESRYDAQFPALGLAARIPKRLVNSIQWAGGRPPHDVDGDGLLLVRNGDDAKSGLVLFLRDNKVVFATPVKYDNITNLLP